MERSAFLPEELRIEILSWLPVKSLLRFKCVSQSWKSIISDSQFIKLHLHRSSSTTRNTDFAHLRSLITLPPERPSATTVTIPDEYDFSGTCNGVICLRTNYQVGIETVLFRFWNPATRLMSQHSPPLRSTRTSCLFYGFGYDCSTHTYKMVVVLSHGVSGEKTVNVYNMGDTCWRSRTIQLSHLPLRYSGGDAVYVNNTLNWLAIVLMNSDRCSILSFDLGKESCAQLPLPYCTPCIDDDFHRSVSILGVLRDCLCICQKDMNMHFVVWQMKEFGVHKSWTLLFNIAGYPYVIEYIMCWRSFAMYMSEAISCCCQNWVCSNPEQFSIPRKTIN